MNTEFIIHSLEDLDTYAQAFARRCPPACFLALHGELGAGKTAFVKCLGKAWDIDNVRSPSFDIMHVHDGLRRLIHIDAYRLKQESLEAFAIDDLCIPPFCLVVEWPECLCPGTLAFQQHLSIEVLPDNARRITMSSL